MGGGGGGGGGGRGGLVTAESRISEQPHAAHSKSNTFHIPERARTAIEAQVQTAKEILSFKNQSNCQANTSIQINKNAG